MVEMKIISLVNTIKIFIIAVVMLDYVIVSHEAGLDNTFSDHNSSELFKNMPV